MNFRAADFELFLDWWDGDAWQVDAAAETPSSNESISFDASAGYYRWRVTSYEGSGAYSLCAKYPR